MKMKGETKRLKVTIQQLFLLGILLFMLPFMNKTTQYICNNCFDLCIQYETDLESESENAELSNIDDDFLEPVSCMLLLLKGQKITASNSFLIKNRMATKAPSPPPKKA
jgi:hypothetical protein